MDDRPWCALVRAIPPGRGAIAVALIDTAKLNGVEPMAWLTDVLERIVSGRTRANALDSLLPWNWMPSNVPAEPIAMAA